jgi:hypothetical protein
MLRSAKTFDSAPAESCDHLKIILDSIITDCEADAEQKVQARVAELEARVAESEAKVRGVMQQKDASIGSYQADRVVFAEERQRLLQENERLKLENTQLSQANAHLVGANACLARDFAVISDWVRALTWTPLPTAPAPVYPALEPRQWPWRNENA